MEPQSNVKSWLQERVEVGKRKTSVEGNAKDVRGYTCFCKVPHNVVNGDGGGI